MRHVFIVGSKGIPGAYGGYETFVDKLTEYHQNHPQLRYHVACKDTENKEEIYHNARCFHIKVPNIGSAQAIWYDVAALRRLAVETVERRAGIEGFRLSDGRILNVLAEGRLVNLAAGNGHPAEIMDMSFAVQALSLEWLVKHQKELEKKVYDIPAEIDDQIGRVKLAAMGLAIDTLTPEQEAYLSGWEA